MNHAMINSSIYGKTYLIRVCGIMTTASYQSVRYASLRCVTVAQAISDIVSIWAHSLEAGLKECGVLMGMFTYYIYFRCYKYSWVKCQVLHPKLDAGTIKTGFKEQN